MYEGVAENIISLIERTGRNMTLRTITETGGTSWQPTFSPGTDQTIKVATAPYTREESENSLVLENDVKGFIASTIIINVEQIIIDNDALKYTIVALREVGPGVDVFLYIAQMRK